MAIGKPISFNLLFEAVILIRIGDIGVTTAAIDRRHRFRVGNAGRLRVTIRTVERPVDRIEEDARVDKE
jgi:hypothetical protein